MSDKPKLKQLRAQIDKIDAELHATLVRRAAVIHKVRAQKDTKAVHIRPAREVTMIRDLLRRPRGYLPAELIVRLWREMIPAFTLQEQRFTIAVTEPDNARSLWDSARDFFGSSVPLRAVPSAAAAIGAVAAHKATVAMVPLPQQGERTPWWTLLTRHRDLKVYMGLPYVAGMKTNARGDTRGALFISRLVCGPTGKDRTLVVVVSAHAMAAVRAAAKRCGLALDGVLTHKKGRKTAYLLTCRGLFDAADARLHKLAGALGIADADLTVIGGYAMPVGRT